MTTFVTNITGFNKSKEDLTWFVKKAITDRKGDAHAEVYHCLLEMFMDADSNKDGLVSRASFSILIDMAESIPRKYGYAPIDSEMYRTEVEKEEARKRMFDSMDLKSTGVITFDDWYKFSMEHIIAKTASIAAHPILDGNEELFKQFLKAAITTGSEVNIELYWFLVELFTEHDTGKDGVVMFADFPTMRDRMLETPKELNVTHPDKNLFI